MSFSSSGGGRQIRTFNEINITPLTDIFLVLLIIMMFMAPMFQQNNKNITVPKINAGAPMEEQAITVEITEDGDVQMDGKVIPKGELVAALKAQTKGNSDMGIVVRADAKAKGDPVMTVFDAASQAGFKRLTIAGEPLKEKKE